MDDHYTTGRRWSEISKAWIFESSWDDHEEIARLNAEVVRLKAELVEAQRFVRDEMLWPPLNDDSLRSEYIAGIAQLTAERDLLRYAVGSHARQRAALLQDAEQQLAEAMAELSEQESRANRWMTGCQLAREQLAEARLALRLIDIDGVDQRVRDVAQAALEVKDG